jgi:hypothetical protein
LKPFPYTVRKTKRDAGPKLICDRKFRPVYVDDGFFRLFHFNSGFYLHILYNIFCPAPRLVFLTVKSR